MILPSKKRAAGVILALTLTLTAVMGCGFSNGGEKQAAEPVAAESLTFTEDLTATAVPVVTEAVAARASEKVEVVPTYDRTKPIYEVYKNGWAVSVPADWQWYIRDMCIKYDFPEPLIYGMILTESTFDASASNSGCYGLAQINKFWIRGANITHFTDDYRSRDLCDAYDNILTLFEMWVYARDTYGLDPWVQADQVKLLYWHNTGKDPTNVTKWKYATKAIGHGNELVLLQGE